MASLIDWSDEKKINKKPKDELPFINILKRHGEVKNYSERINTWHKRPTQNTKYWEKQTLKTVDKMTPEYCLLHFLDFWKNKRWGLMNDLLIHTINNPFSTIKRLKDDYSSIQLLNFEILNLEDKTPAISIITAQLTIIQNKKEFSKSYSIHLNYLDKNGDLLLRNEQGGQWRILQSSLSRLLFRTST